MGVLQEMMSYAFFSRAIIVGVLVSLCASLLGVTLVLKRYSMIGDGLSHVGFGALAVASALHMEPLYVTIPIVVIAAFFLLRISENSKIKGDAAIALISSSALALGVVTTSINGTNTDLSNYLFGSILSVSKSDQVISIVLSVIVIVIYILFYHRVFAITFDENFAKATGLHTEIYNIVIALLTAITIVLGMRLMGTLLISSLIIFPSLTSMRVFKRFSQVVVSSACISVICFVLGMIFSYLYELPSGASVVIANLGVLVLFSAIAFIISKINRK